MNGEVGLALEEVFEKEYFKKRISRLARKSNQIDELIEQGVTLKVAFKEVPRIHPAPAYDGTESVELSFKLVDPTDENCVISDSYQFLMEAALDAVNGKTTWSEAGDVFNKLLEELDATLKGLGIKINYFAITQVNEYYEAVYKFNPVDLYEDTEELPDNYETIREGFEGNMPCDNTGFCAGTSCKMFFKCHG